MKYCRLSSEKESRATGTFLSSAEALMPPFSTLCRAITHTESGISVCNRSNSSVPPRGITAAVSRSGVVRACSFSLLMLVLARSLYLNCKLSMESVACKAPIPLLPLGSTVAVSRPMASTASEINTSIPNGSL